MAKLTDLASGVFCSPTRRGDSVEMIKATLDALEAGDDETARRVFETVCDVLPRASHRKSRK